MEGPPTSYWAKLTGDPRAGPGAVTAWHSLEHHSADVAACTEAILRQTLLGKRLGTLAGQEALDESQIARLCILATWHDLGKFNLGFQNKALHKPAFRRGHVREAMALFATADERLRSRLVDAMPVEELETWAHEDGAARLLCAAVCHHGRPYRIAGETDAIEWGRWCGRDPFDELKALVQRSFEWFPEALIGGTTLPHAAEFQHAYAGIVMLADWLGSSTLFFPFAEHAAEDRIDYARGAAQDAIRWIGLDVRAARASFHHVPGMRDFSPFTPWEIQELVQDAPIPSGGSIQVLEAETGSGKTEAAIARYLRLLHANAVDGMYFALPTRTAAQQVFERVLDAAVHAFPDPELTPPVVLAVPGYIRVDDQEGRALPCFEVQWSDDPSDRYRYRGWAAENPKRYLAGAIVVGTIDQALMSTLCVPHAHLRASALMRQLLVIDEVHASDAYMTRLTEHLLRTHTQAGGHALLMSATLGASARVRLLSSLGSDPTIPSLEVALAAAYPAVEIASVGGDHWHRSASSPGSAKHLTVTFGPPIDEADRIAARAVEAASEGANVLIIRNTVADCIDTQEAVEALIAVEGGVRLLEVSDIQAPHHSRFAREDRLSLDRAIESAFGKDRTSNGRIAVATQTVQQSLDLDADFMISDLCPVDVLLQRAGRLHRHHREVRPAGYRKARLEVLAPSEGVLGEQIGADGNGLGRHGLGSVYADLRILESTRRLIAEERLWRIPEMARELVERATHPEALAQCEDLLGEVWTRHGQWVEGVIAAEVSAGQASVLDRSILFGDFAFPDDDTARRVATRLGDAARRVELSDVIGPFGQAVTEIVIPSHLVRGVPAGVEAEDVVQLDDGVTFRLGDNAYHYTRLGLRRVDTGP